MKIIIVWSLSVSSMRLLSFSESHNLGFCCIWQWWLVSIKCLSSVSHCFNQHLVCVCMCICVRAAFIGMCPLTTAIKYKLYFKLWEPIKNVFSSQNPWKQIKITYRWNLVLLAIRSRCCAGCWEMLLFSKMWLMRCELSNGPGMQWGPCLAGTHTHILYVTHINACSVYEFRKESSVKGKAW